MGMDAMTEEDAADRTPPRAMAIATPATCNGDGGHGHGMRNLWNFHLPSDSCRSMGCAGPVAVASPQAEQALPATSKQPA